MRLNRYPHNTGYLFNDDLDSVQAFLLVHNNSVGKWLKDAGYYTSFLGKYVNSCESHAPSGWSHWGGFIQTYDFYNASLFDIDWDVEPVCCGAFVDVVFLKSSFLLCAHAIAHINSSIERTPLFLHPVRG